MLAEKNFLDAIRWRRMGFHHARGLQGLDYAHQNSKWTRLIQLL
jgi:hypothetical protein